MILSFRIRSGQVAVARYMPWEHAPHRDHPEVCPGSFMDGQRIRSFPRSDADPAGKDK
jgi:hypothetical protein